MDPVLQQILDEIKMMKASVDALSPLKETVEDLMVSMTCCIDSVEQNLGDRFSAMEKAAEVFEDWRPKVEAGMEDLKMEVGALQKTVYRVVLDSTPSTSVGIFAKPTSVAATPTAGNPIDGPTGHRSPIANRENVLGKVFTQNHSPDKGTYEEPHKQLHRSTSHSQFDLKYAKNDWQSSPSGCQSFPTSGNASRMPKLNFPKFDGENPKLWIKRSQDYFELRQVDSKNWIKIASMYFTKAAACWLQSVEKRVQTVSWVEFC
jgi:hypothetical protein